MRKARTQALTLGTGFLAVLVPVVFAFAAPAGAQDTLTNTAGNVTLTAPCSESGGSTNCSYTPTSGTPYSSGQQIDVSAGANSSLTGDSQFFVEECSDYEGLSSNVPTTTATNNCDGVTAYSSTNINTVNGSIPTFNYTILALPDGPTFGESAGHLPVCGLYPNDCVLFIGEESPFSGGLSAPHLFSAPFQVQSNSDDGGENPGDGTPEVPLAVALPLLAVAIGGGSLYLRRRRAHAA